MTPLLNHHIWQDLKYLISIEYYPDISLCISDYPISNCENWFLFSFPVIPLTSQVSLSLSNKIVRAMRLGPAGTAFRTYWGTSPIQSRPKAATILLGNSAFADNMRNIPGSLGGRGNEPMSDNSKGYYKYRWAQ